MFAPEIFVRRLPAYTLPMQQDLERVLFDEATIMSRLDQLAAEISAEYRDRDLTVIAILNGSIILMADLLRRIPLPLKFDCLSVASYHGGTTTSGEIVFKQIALPDVENRHVLILDDILDSGVTLAAIREKLASRRPLSVKTCVLLRKRKPRRRPVEVDYVGFDIGDEFVVGYGLDYMEHYRNLPCIGVLRKTKILSANPT
ncbi:MAG TPA: hypoxanthine phosphoribosyltransferase [Chthoniobacterales bacterium]|nr:hypoxanthine phosphoribosyltransferase [Chthoniobacterales bacterium]